MGDWLGGGMELHGETSKLKTVKLSREIWLYWKILPPIDLSHSCQWIFFASDKNGLIKSRLTGASW
jgi:hypothetical protein